MNDSSLSQVGTHVINTIHKFLYQPITKKDREAAEKRKLQAALKQRMAKTQGKKIFSQLFNLAPKLPNMFIPFVKSSYLKPPYCQIRQSFLFHASVKVA